VILAPRHLEKADFFAEQLSRSGLSFSRWSDGNHSGARGGCDVLLLDVMGKLEEAYSVAHLAFVGGTLVDIGGHNPLEPAMYGVPVVVGPYTSVIRDVVVSMKAVCGIIELSSPEDISQVLQALIGRDVSLREIGKSGQQIWNRHRGAVKRALSVLAHEPC
jgi:3-deoxy-D-manno-octulosonic-acid transferase